MRQHVDNLDRHHLKSLAAHGCECCLTLTMDCETVGGTAAEQNRIKFKSLLQDADQILKGRGWDEARRADYFAALHAIGDDYGFWRYQDRSFLVLHDGDGILETYRLPFALGDNAMIGRHFYLRAVIPHLQDNQEFGVILLNEGGSQILVTDMLHTGYKLISPPPHLATLKNFLSHYDFEKSLQFVGGGGAGPHFHGQGTAGDKAAMKVYRADYYKQLETWVAGALRKADLDKIFYIADAQTEGLYRAQMHKNHPPMERLTRQNAASEKGDNFLALAMARIEAGREEQRLRAIGDYQMMMGTDGDSVSAGIEEVVTAATDNRIEALFIPAGTEDKIWGRFVPERHEAELHGEHDNSDELVNMAAVRTFIGGGRIIPLSPNDYERAGVMPRYAAICRW